MIPDDRYYTKSHVWVKIDEGVGEIGVTEPILRRLAPLISMELPEQDDEMKIELPFGELEGLRETIQLYAPAEARITEVNEELLWNLDKLMKHPYGKAWLLKIRAHDPQGLVPLMDAEAYAEFCARDLGEEYVDD